MKIIKFSFEDKQHNWRLDEMTFDKITLLVGASGVGKTLILKAFEELRILAHGVPRNKAMCWRVEFESIDQKYVVWEGEIGNKTEYNAYEFISEKLYINEQLLIDRNDNEIKFKGVTTVKLPRDRSVVAILSQEEEVSPICSGFLTIDFFSNAVTSTDQKYGSNIIKNISQEEIDVLKRFIEKGYKLQDLTTTMSNKLICAILLNLDVIPHIKRKFIDIFPTVEDIGALQVAGYAGYEFSLHIKEKNVDTWIPAENISSGMARVLMQLSALHLTPDGTVFLIDEFENSLGANCIRELTKEIITSQRNLQFILTSHHPYIIDNVPFKYWKLVTRNGNVIQTQGVEKFHFEKSKHSSFMQLLQLEEYQTGQSNP